LSIIKNHDASRFEIHVFTIESRFEIGLSSGKIFLKQFDELDCEMHYASFFRSGFSRLHSIAKIIHNLNTHILITTAGLADFESFFISAFKPAPIRIAFVLGSPAQFIPPSFDFGITWIDRLAMDCPIPCLNSGVPYVPQDKPLVNSIRSDYNLPDDAIIIISGGRYPKFQDITLLNLIVDLMRALPNLYYIIIGPTQDQLPNLQSVPEEFKCRIYRFDWSHDYEKYLTLSDIYLDTYPSGGGIILYDAALLKLPIISFTDSDSNQICQSDWSPASELFIEDSIIFIDRNNILNLKSVIEKLYCDKRYREEVGNKAYASVIKLRDNTKSCVKSIEQLYIDITNIK
jgi:predicted O-linked N-acetylglucosamine transferase (SPINDLY family)